MGSFRFKNDTFFENEINDFDLVIAVGTRMLNTEYFDNQKILQIDIDDEEIGRNYKNTQGILGDAIKSLQNLLSELKVQIPPKDSREQELISMKQNRFNPDTIIEPQHSYIEAIRAALPEDGILVAGMTQLGYYSRNRFEVYEPRTYITSSYYGNLGYAFPTALGAKVAQPDKAVVAISGDGGFMFNVQELSTAVRHNINLVTVLFNDNAYGNVMRDQVNMFDGREYGAQLTNPDFIKLAESFGVNAIRVENGAEELKSAIISALKLDQPTLIEVPVGEMPNPFRHY